MEREKLLETWFANMQNMQRVWKPRVYAELGNAQLSFGQMGMLLWVHTKGSVTSKQLVGEMCMTKGAVAQFLDGLDQAGLIIREHDAADRRIVHITLSPAGQKQAQMHIDRRRALFKKISVVLTDDELRTLVAVQQKLADQMHVLNEEEAIKQDESRSKKEQ
jgi:DNA-binding MarR family transcriptional regulator